MKIDFKTNLPLEQHKLENGLEVILVNSTTSPIVSINLAYKVGSKNELRGKTGFAHLFEHLMFEGSQNVPKGQFDKLCSTAGGTNNAYTTYDYTAYTMTLPSHQLELGLWLESDRMFFSEVSSVALANQQNVVVEEIKQTVENQPYGRWRELLAQTAYNENCSYSWEVHGSKDDVQNASLEDVRHFFKTFYQPQNAVLSIAGNINFSETLEKVKKYFEVDKNILPIPKVDFNPDFLNFGLSSKFYDNVPHSASFVSFHTNGISDENLFAGDLLIYLLATGKSSIFYNKLVFEKQIASQVGAFLDKRETSSLLTIYAIANNEKISAETLTNEINDIIKNLKNDYLFENLLSKARNQILTQIAQELQFSSSIADMTSYNFLFRNNPEWIYYIMEKYENIDINDLINFADKYLSVDKSIIVEVEPK